MLGVVVFYIAFLCRELILFAAVGFLIGNLDELAIDAIWLIRAAWRSVTIFRSVARGSVANLAPPDHPGRMAIFIAAWDEAGVINAMLRFALATLEHDDFHIYVGCYANDAATRQDVRSIDDRRLRIVVNPRNGPTSKADCLNILWHAMAANERRDGVPYKAIVLHDAEDIVHRDELRVFDRLIERAALVQLPVRPLPDPNSRWVSGHYCDEFAEAHGKVLVVREFLGAAIPSAGVGCAFDRVTLGKIAALNGGAPFSADSLTEDYELGLKIGALGERTILARLPVDPASGRDLVQTCAHFPATLQAAERQKARWVTGIALAGYDRMGWRGGIAEMWMRARDRRALFSALVCVTGYAAIMLTALLATLHWFVGSIPPDIPRLTGLLVALNAVLMLWRSLVRAFFVSRAYGWRMGLLSVPRLIVANVISIIAARRALVAYLRLMRTGEVRRDKTRHHFPADPLAAQ